MSAYAALPMLLARGLHMVGNEAMSHLPCRDVLGAYHAFETGLSSHVHVNLCVRSSHKQSCVQLVATLPRGWPIFCFDSVDVVDKA